MSRLFENLRVARFAVLSGAYDYFAIYSLRSWVFGWMVRVLSQVTFFALIGKLLKSDEQTQFLLIGNAVMIGAMGGIFGLNMTTAERANGTLSLLVASPSRPVVVFAARGLYVVADAVLSGLLGLFIIGPIFGLHFPWPRILLVVPLTTLVGLSAYCFSTFLAGVILRKREGQGLVVNTTIVALMALCGVNVPVSFFPTWLEWLASLLPITNGLEAIRDTVNGAPAATIAWNVLAELAVATGWLSLALATFGRFVGHGRRSGSLEYAS
jgi:ABC-2 type transport system permease protein